MDDDVYVNDRGGCKGDSDGPIVHAASGVLLGVILAGMPDCEDGAPNVYANIEELRDFIENHMG